MILTQVWKVPELLLGLTTLATAYYKDAATHCCQPINSSLFGSLFRKIREKAIDE